MGNTVLTWEGVIHPEDHPRVKAQFQAYIDRRAERYQVEYRCLCHDGSYLWVEDRGYIIDRNEDGSVARMLGAQRNIDAGKREVVELQQRNQSLEALVAEPTRELSWANQQLHGDVPGKGRWQGYDQRVMRPLVLRAGSSGLIAGKRGLKKRPAMPFRHREPKSATAASVSDMQSVSQRA